MGWLLAYFDSHANPYLDAIVGEMESSRFIGVCRLIRVASLSKSSSFSVETSSGTLTSSSCNSA